MSEMRKAKFTIDGGVMVTGYTDGQTWNGWACPSFELSEIGKWLTETNNLWEYHPTEDVLVVYFVDSKGNEEAEPEEYEGMDIEVGDTRVHVYSVGAGSWVWDQYDPRPLHTIAWDIRCHWQSPYFGAVPYIDAMRRLTWMDDKYGMDDGDTIVRYFLSNATTWRGEDARRIKAELKSML